MRSNALTWCGKQSCSTRSPATRMSPPAAKSHTLPPVAGERGKVWIASGGNCPDKAIGFRHVASGAKLVRHRQGKKAQGKAKTGHG
jgi:hypothetical protein